MTVYDLCAQEKRTSFALNKKISNEFFWLYKKNPARAGFKRGSK